MRRDLADLIADPMRHERSLRIIEHNALLVIQPARAFIDLRDDRVQPKGQNLVSQNAFGWVKDFPLPGKMIDEIGYILCVKGSRRNDRCAFGFATRNVTGGL